MSRVHPYSILAECYDDVMEHVDYDEWASYVLDVCYNHDHEPGAVLELACGTGSFAFIFSAIAGLTSYRGVDGSRDMIKAASSKKLTFSKIAASGVEFGVQSFAELNSHESRAVEYDTILLLYDGLNYLMTDVEISDLFSRVSGILRPGGLFIFDQSTPANSIQNADYFEDAGTSGSITYVRKSSFDEETSVHTTVFDMTKDGQEYQEVHTQQCYTGPHIQKLISGSELNIEAGYSGFSLEAADTESERIHWVARKPQL